MVSKQEFEEARRVIEEYSAQKTHQVRGNILEDCPTEDYEKGNPKGNCETDGHYLCETCKHCDIDSFNRLKF